jgi:histidine phosphotransferase ChpT
MSGDSFISNKREANSEGKMQELPQISAMDLGALLCSRVCHDIISPVGAIANGLELLDENSDKETHELAMNLIKSSAANASARLQFARIAFGAAGSSGANIDTGDAETVAKYYYANDAKTAMNWHGERVLLPKNQVKLLLNMLLVAGSAIPRGGQLQARIENSNSELRLSVSASGKAARVPSVFRQLLEGNFSEALDAHAIQPFYTLKLAEAADMRLSATVVDEQVIIEAA